MTGDATAGALVVEADAAVRADVAAVEAARAAEGGGLAAVAAAADRVATRRWPVRGGCLGCRCRLVALGD